MRLKHLVLALAALLLPAFIGTAHAQSEIFALPSATVIDKGSKYLEGDLMAAPRSYNDDGFYTLGVRGVYGLTDNLELGLNVFGTLSKTPTAAELQPGVKYRWFNEGDLQISSGIVGYLPITHPETEHPFAMGYTLGRYQTHIGGAYAPAFSLGGWGLLNNNTPGSKAGVILGLEQPLLLDGAGKPKVSFVADWMSGKQTHPGFSSFNPGIVIQITHSTTLGVGYQLSNVSRKNDNVLIWFGFSF